MRVLYRLLVTAALLPLAGGCASTEPEPPMAVIAMEPPPTLEIPPPPPVSIFPSSPLSVAEAERLLAGDPMALRFLALRRLGEDELAPILDLIVRKDMNIGALLPLTAPTPPATGLERPIPPLDQLAARFAELKQGRGTDRTREAERGFMLDALLSKTPAARMALSPPDRQSARIAMDRLGRVARAGLVSTAEQEAEAAALNALMANLPETLTPPPAPPKKKATATTGSGGHGARMPGGVSGRLEVIPSPPGVTAPKVAPGFTGPVGAHLLSMGSSGHGDRAWEGLKKEFPELASLSFTVSRADLGDLGATYRLIAGPMDAAAAAKLCAGISAKGQTCVPTPFPK